MMALVVSFSSEVTGMSSCDKKKAKRQRVEVKKSNFVDLSNAETAPHIGSSEIPDFVDEHMVHDGDDMDWDLIPKGTTSTSNAQKSENEDNHGKYTLLESLLSSYKSIQQTLLLHILYADDIAGNEKMDSIKKSFKELNEKANLFVD
ncbi:hypothetical protein ACET3Z_028684 [Daucus carota]